MVVLFCIWSGRNRRFGTILLTNTGNKEKITKMNKRIQTLFILFLLSQFCFGQKQLEMKDFLKHFYDVSLLPSYKENTFPDQESSYDRTGLNADGDGDKPFLKQNADSSFAMFNVKSRGLINRIWTPMPSEDSLDFYTDKFISTTKNITIKPNESKTIFETNSAGRILGFEIQSNSGLNKLAKNIDLKLTFDNEPRPAIYCPLSDYFRAPFSS